MLRKRVHTAHFGVNVLKLQFIGVARGSTGRPIGRPVYIGVTKLYRKDQFYLDHFNCLSRDFFDASTNSYDERITQNITQPHYINQ